MIGRYIVENWETCETIAEFDSEEKRQAWLDENVTEGYTSEGIKISIYEI